MTNKTSEKLRKKKAAEVVERLNKMRAEKSVDDCCPSTRGDPCDPDKSLYLLVENDEEEASIARFLTDDALKAEHWKELLELDDIDVVIVEIPPTMAKEFKYYL